jgi:signal transduction histidine kinase
VTVLRSGSEAAAAGLGVAAVRDLVERAARGGADVRLDVAGFDDSGELPPEVATCLFRLVQESLTNATKYAPGAAVSVRLHRAGASLDVAVDNVAAEVVTAPLCPAAGTAWSDARARPGIGGTVTAGPAAGGGWSVRARSR